MTRPQSVDGIDISHHQGGKLDLAAAKKRGLKWLYHKATEGDGFRDPSYPTRRAEAKRAGIPFGAYHFARAEKGDAAKEASFFLAYATPRPGDLRPVLDLETLEGLSPTDIRSWAKRFVTTVEKATGVNPTIYTPFDLGTADNGCLLWRPRYNNSNIPPQLKWHIWQFSDGVFGVPNTYPGFGHVDLNVMRSGLTVARMQIPSKQATLHKPIGKTGGSVRRMV
jgi:GH25 family lysozyme M1 (1,4-beta-N-acetylmuramidase)